MSDRFLKVAIRAAKKAGDLLGRHYLQPKRVGFKGRRVNLVTNLDRASEKLIVRILRREFPDHDIVGEEFKRPLTGSPYCWFIDPLDGTVNYVHSLQYFSVSIGLTHKGRPICGAVYAPALGEMFTASQGRGAHLNGRRIRVSRQSKLRDSFVVTGFPYSDAGRRKQLRYFKRFTLATQALRRLGCASIDLCYVADGVFDGFWENTLMPWDLAAGHIIIEEAGGRVTDFRGKPVDLWKGDLVGSNGAIHDAMLRLVR